MTPPTPVFVLPSRNVAIVLPEGGGREPSTARGSQTTVRGIAVVVAAALLTGCSTGEPSARPRTSPPATRAPEPEQVGWRKPRFVPVREAVNRLARHVDVPVVLPTDRLAGLRGYRGWLADPRYLDWGRRGPHTVGTLFLVSHDEQLRISYGYAIPDGCGGRDTAIPTDVLGEPALLWTYPGQSSIIWPVKPHGRIGRFGLDGTFDGYQILRLAESMETKLRRAPAHDPGC